MPDNRHPDRPLADDNEHHGLPEDAPNTINPWEEDDLPEKEEPHGRESLRDAWHKAPESSRLSAACGRLRFLRSLAFLLLTEICSYLPLYFLQNLPITI